jgi:hypothetical protein
VRKKFPFSHLLEGKASNRGDGLASVGSERVGIGRERSCSSGTEGNWCVGVQQGRWNVEAYMWRAIGKF